MMINDNQKNLQLINYDPYKKLSLKYSLINFQIKNNPNMRFLYEYNIKKINLIIFTSGKF